MSNATLKLVYRPGIHWRRWKVDMPLGWKMTGTGTDLVSGKRDMLLEGVAASQNAAHDVVRRSAEKLKAEQIISSYAITNECH